MDGVFNLSEAARTDFLRALVLNFSGSCAYICLWQQYDSHLINNNRLFFLDGFYNINNQPSSSSSLGSNNNGVAERLFNQYRCLTFDVFDDCVPGLAFRNHHPYLELQQSDLLRLVSTEIQLQFFQEARIKTAVFMGCNKGEIELGFSNLSQIDIQAALRSLFPEDFSRQPQTIINYQNNPQYSLSSSSLRSSSLSLLSTNSTNVECSSSLLLSSISSPCITSMPQNAETLGAMVPTLQLSHQVIPTHYFLTPPEGEQEAIIREMLHVITSSSSTSTSHDHDHQQNLLPYNNNSSSMLHYYYPDQGTTTTAHAFKKYRGEDHIGASIIRFNCHRQSMMKRSFEFYRRLNSLRMIERVQEDTRVTSIQLQHMISERRRREKLNDNFQALRALLPPGTKKDKASILAAAKETLRNLSAEIEEFNIRNHELTTLLSVKEANASELWNEERLNIRVSNILVGPQSSSPTSEERMVELQVTVRGGGENSSSSQVDISIRLLEFFKRIQNVMSLISMDANTHDTVEGTTINQLTFTLSIIQGSAWDERAFQEAVRRLVADLLNGHVGQKL